MARDTCRSSSETDPVTDAPFPRSPAEPGSPPAGPSAAWKESLRDLDETARGLRAPIVGELSDQGVTVEFPGAGESARLTFVVEDDGSVACYELTEGRRRRRFPTVDASLSAVRPSSFHRAGFLAPE